MDKKAASRYSVGQIKDIWAEIKYYIVTERIQYLSLARVSQSVPQLNGRPLSANDKLTIVSIVRREKNFKILDFGQGKVIQHLNLGELA